MKFPSLIFLSLFFIAALANEEPEYIPTPQGPMRRDCVHKVASGSELRRDPMTNALHVFDAQGKLDRKLPFCNVEDGFPLYKLNKPVELINSPKGELKESEKNVKERIKRLPSYYDGWTAYTAFRTSKTFDAFLGNFSVPDAPQNAPIMFFLFTGLQNIDWIPKVDPEPNSGFDIIQPVLQYPGDEGNYFSVKSWYVTTDVGTVYSDEVQVNSGDVIFGNMTRVGKESWFIGSTSTQTGLSTTIRVSHSRLTNQPWAYNTLEMYGAQDCTTYPTIPVTFNNLQLFSAGKVIPSSKVRWLVNPKNQPKKFCKELPIVKPDGSVIIKFK